MTSKQRLLKNAGELHDLAKSLTAAAERLEKLACRLPARTSWELIAEPVADITDGLVEALRDQLGSYDAEYDQFVG